MKNTGRGAPEDVAPRQWRKEKMLQRENRKYIKINRIESVDLFPDNQQKPTHDERITTLLIQY